MKATKVIYLFSDTNLFIQCRPLEELDWSGWSEFDEVHLIVTRPVQREIDNQKNKGNNRIGKRARKAHSLFRDIIIDGQGYKLIHDANPQVRLLVDPSCQPSPEVADRLDYNKPDDELVGCLHAHRAQSNDTDARLLTHDSGPMGTAKMLALPFEVIPDSWLIPPENNESEKKIKSLESDLARLTKAEPEIHITCLDGEGCVIDKLEIEHPIYEPLSDEEILELIVSLESYFPLVTDFGSREPAEREPKKGQYLIRIKGMKDIYTPVTDEEISEFTETKYPDWINKCKSVLCDLHTKMQYELGTPVFCFVASNKGTRPAKDVLVEITAKGNFKICPPKLKDDEDQEKTDAEKKRKLPRPPVAPQGKWSMGFGRNHPNSQTLMDAVRAMENFGSPLTGIGSVTAHNPLFDVSALHRPDLRRDPNSFFYKPNRSMVPVETIKFECEQWRHSVADEQFAGDIFFNQDVEEIRGALECQIHAENMSSPVGKTIPVIIQITKTSVREHAEELLTGLIKYGV